MRRCEKFHPNFRPDIYVIIAMYFAFHCITLLLSVSQLIRRHHTTFNLKTQYTHSGPHKFICPKIPGKLIYFLSYSILYILCMICIDAKYASLINCKTSTTPNIQSYILDARYYIWRIVASSF